jgi:hypothetical protein
MDFTKFVSMLESNSLFFSRADLLGDPFEGSSPRETERQRPNSFAGVPSDVQLKASKAVGSFYRWAREWTFVNCWHKNEYESAAMWKLYAKSAEAVAVKTTYDLLDSQLHGNVYLGVVDYIDYETAWLPEGNLLYPYAHKRRSFAHEHEVRAVIQELPYCGEELDMKRAAHSAGIAMPVNLGTLLQGIHVAPTCPKWFMQLVGTVCKRYNVSAPVKQSNLDSEPFF